LESAISEGDRAVKRKVISLERNIEQLTLMYHQLVSQKSALKVENQVNEKRIQRKNERISVLEKRLAEQRDHVNMLRNQVEALKAALSDSQKTMPSSTLDDMEMKQKLNQIKSGGGKLASGPLRGGQGGGGVMTAADLMGNQTKKQPGQNYYEKTTSSLHTNK